MNQLLKKLGFGDKMAHNLGAILIVAAAGDIIYGLPYFRLE